MFNLFRLYQNLPAPVVDTGKAVRLSASRKWVCDLLHFARGIPTVPVQKRLDLSRVVEARGQLEKRPRWVTLFTKAYAQLCAETPELRRAYLKYPYARLWQHGCPVASVAINREHAGERCVFFAKIREPQAMTIAELDAVVDHHVESPIEEVETFRLAIGVSGMIQPVRRLIWWLGLHWRGIWREAIFGTFGVSVYSGTGAQSLHPISPLTTLLNYGPIDESGCVDVRVVYDHRVMDGLVVAEGLGRLQVIFDTVIAEELKGMAKAGDLKIAA